MAHSVDGWWAPQPTNGSSAHFVSLRRHTRHPIAALDDGGVDPPDLPVYFAAHPACDDPPAVDAFEVTPGAERGEVFGFVGG